MSVQILLSTYNGERYLRPLLDSLGSQGYPDLSILIRDDGSIDNTPALLREYASRLKNVAVVHGEHLGFVQSFFTLLGLASRTSKYLALCDQDDVWQADKVSRAVELLSACPPNLPALYCSRLALVDENLKPLRLSEMPAKGLSFRNALVENHVVGCTSLFNQSALQLLTPVPSACVSHDWWIYLVASAFGAVVYDREPRILYRQHPHNVFGISSSVLDRWKTKLRGFLNDGKSRLIVKQAEEFRRIYGSALTDEHRKVINRLIDSRKQTWDRLRYAWSCDVYRQTILDQCILKARIALDLL
jgi:glycosyltransferase involved in cell wall biosynthesis